MKKLTVLLPFLLAAGCCFAGDNSYNEDNPTIGGSINTALIGVGIVLIGYLLSRVPQAKGLGQGLLIIGGLGVFAGLVQLIGILVGSIASTSVRILVIMGLVALALYVLRSRYYSVIGKSEHEPV